MQFIGRSGQHTGGCKCRPWTTVRAEFGLQKHLPSPLVFIGRLSSDPVLLPKGRIICRHVFEQLDACYTVVDVVDAKV